MCRVQIPPPPTIKFFMGYVNGVPLGQLLINYIRKVFKTTFMESIKSCQKKLIALSFFYNIFLKIVSKPMFLSHLLTFPIIYLFIL